MATPTWDQLIRPVLELACKEPITRHTAKDHVCKVIPMSKEEREARLKSGMLRILNRTGWAMSHMKKAGLIEQVGKATYRATDKGIQFLADNENEEIDYHTLAKLPGFVEAWKKASEKNQKAKAEKDEEAEESETDSTPEEAIEQAVSKVESTLRDELLEQLKTINPYRFEQVVLDVLAAMGYGGSREEAAQVTQKSNDGGIDGVINEDRLGLDVIYVQAKRWQGNVGRTEIQNFVGALAGKKANKGVFITTSDFNSNATEYAREVTQKVILINGERFAELMIEHDVGTSTDRVIKLKSIDSDYFED